MTTALRHSAVSHGPTAGRCLRAVLFDLDGTLVDSYEVWQRVVRDAARHFGALDVTPESFAAGWGQGIESDVERWFPGASVAAVEAWYDAHFLDHRAHLRVHPDAADILASLRALALPTALVTNTPAQLARAVLEETGLRLDVVVGGRDALRSKPAPEPVRLAAKLLGVPASETVLVGDTAFDRDAARAAGALFAGFGIEGDVTLARLTDLADLVGAGVR